VALYECGANLLSLQGAQKDGRHVGNMISRYTLLVYRRLDQGSTIVSAIHESGRLRFNWVISVCVATMLALPPVAAQTYSPQCPIAGRYSVEGYVPGAANPYRGEAIISTNGTGCHMKWFPPNDSEGKGDYTDNVLTIYFTFASGGAGVVKYTRSASGEMNGTWWMDVSPSNKGTEKLMPIELAPR
jgi:hypothetical protein